MNDTAQPATSIVEYQPTAAALAALRDKYAAVVYDCTKPAELTAARAARFELRTLRTALEEKRSDLKKPVLERGRALDTEAKKIEAQIIALEEPIDQQIKIEERRRADEAAAREKAEADRLGGIQGRIAALGALPASLIGHSAADLEAAIADVQARDLQAQEFATTAENTRQTVLRALQELLAGRMARDAQEEADRAQRAAQAHQEAEERAAREAAEREAAETARREREARAAEDRARREQIEREQAEHRAKMEAEARQAREAREREETEARERRAELDAEQARADSERRELEAEKLAIADARKLMTTFIGRFGERREFSAIVIAINKYLTAHPEAGK